MKNMLKICLAASWVSAFCGLNAAAVKPQPVKTKASPVFDAKNKTFKPGNKQLVFADNGSCKVNASGKCIVTGLFFFSTAFAGS